MSRENREGKSFKKHLRKIIYIFETAIFPSFCHLCHTALEPYERIACYECFEKIIPVGKNVCKKCGKPLSADSPSLCINCINLLPPFILHRSFAFYEGVMREIMFLIKFKKMAYLAKAIARYSYQSLEDKDKIFDCDYIIPVPISKERRKERGFNQSEIIAEQISMLIKKELLKNVLIKIKNTIPQSLLPLKERKKNIAGSFGLRNVELIKGRRILLIDDIYTSGSTVFECSKILKKNGAEDVRVFTIARVGMGNSQEPLEMLDS